MGNKQRHPDVIEFEKKRIAGIASQYIQKHGLHSMSIRKLATELKISPTTLYNYFSNIDEIYLYTLRIGFDELYEKYQEAYDSHDDANEKLRAMNKAYFTFGIEQPHFIDMMFILDLPKYQDFLKDGKKDAAVQAYKELESAVKIRDLCKEVLLQLCEINSALQKEMVTLYTAKIFSELTGLVTVVNSRALVYIGGGIDKTSQYILESISKPYEA